MAVTLAQAKLLTQDKLDKQVIDEFRKDKLLDLMIFDDSVPAIGGSTLAYTYNRVSTLPTAAFRAINAEYVGQESATTQTTVNLKVFGGSFQIDRVIQNNVKGITDEMAFQLDQKIKATKALFADTFINGDSGVDANSFDGLSKAITGSSTEFNTVTAIDLSTSALIDANYKAFMDMLDKMLASLDGAPSALMVNRSLGAIMNGIARRSMLFSSGTDNFGQTVTKYADIPIVVVGDKPGTANPIIPTTTNETSLYAVRVGLDGVHAVSPSGAKLINTYLPDMKLPGAVKTGEVEMVAAVALKATRSAGVFRKIKI